MIKLSVCIPTYNRAGYLKKCLRSVLTFDDPHLEIIVQDNCSPDNTEQVVKSFHDDRIHYFKNEMNIGGVKNAINIIEKASGDYIFYLTDDDYLFPDALDRVKAFIEQHKPYFFTSDIFMFLEKSKKVFNYSYFDFDRVIGPGQPDEVAKVFLSSHIITRVCFKREALDFEFLSKYGDNWYPQMLIALLMSVNGPLGYLAQPLGVHVWENETFWGIDPSEKNTLNGGIVNIIKSFSNRIDYAIIKSIIMFFSAYHRGYTQPELVSLLNPEDQKQLYIYNEEIRFSLGISNIDRNIEKFNNRLFKKWLQVSLLNKSSITEILKQDRINNVAVFGTKEIGLYLLEDLKQQGINVICFLDNNEALHNQKIEDIRINSPQWLLTNSEEVDAVIISVEGIHSIKIKKQVDKFVKGQIPVFTWKELLL